MEELDIFPPYNNRRKIKRKYWILVGLITSGIALQLFTIGGEYFTLVKEGNKMDITRGEVHNFIVFGHDMLYNASINLDELMNYVKTETSETSHKVVSSTRKIDSLDHDVRADLDDYKKKFNAINERVETMASQMNHSMTIIADIDERFTKLMEKLNKLGL